MEEVLRQRSNKLFFSIVYDLFFSYKNYRQFLKFGYAVIFLSRSTSLQPFGRHLNEVDNLVNLLHWNSQTKRVELIDKLQNEMQQVILFRDECMQKGTLLKISFVTIHDYLYLLRGIAIELNAAGPSAIVFSAAAVSDFFIPKSSMTEHKIQSSDGGLNLTLSQVPKMLKPLCSTWCPRAYVVSFKVKKSQFSFQQKY